MSHSLSWSYAVYMIYIRGMVTHVVIVLDSTAKGSLFQCTRRNLLTYLLINDISLKEKKSQFVVNIISI